MAGIARLLRVTRDITASEIAMLALESDPATDDFVMIPKGTVGKVIEDEGDTLDMLFDVPDWIGACGCYLSIFDLEEVESEESESAVCPRCGTEDTDVTTILDHGMCSACLGSWKSGELPEQQETKLEGTEGQDRDNYADDQDRESYTVDEEWEQE